MNKYIENNMNLEKFNSSNILEKDIINKDEASVNEIILYFLCKI